MPNCVHYHGTFSPTQQKLFKYITAVVRNSTELLSLGSKNVRATILSFNTKLTLGQAQNTVKWLYYWQEALLLVRRGFSHIAFILHLWNKLTAVTTPTYYMERSGRLVYGMHLKNNCSGNKYYAKGDFSYACMQYHTCWNWWKVPIWPDKTHSHVWATILVASRVPITCPPPPPLLFASCQNYLHKLIDRIWHHKVYCCQRANKGLKGK